MIILDELTNKNLANVTILLTKSEATQMLGYLENLLSDLGQNAHFHLNSDCFTKEITLARYEKDECLDRFADKYKKQILLDG